jgi:hypothetical protein
MDELPHMLPTTNRAARDRIEAVLADLPWSDGRSLGIDSQHARRTVAGVLRKAFMPELARMRDTEDTLNRVRRVARQYPEDGTVPVRRILAALYGEERP